MNPDSLRNLAVCRAGVIALIIGSLFGRITPIVDDVRLVVGTAFLVRYFAARLKLQHCALPILVRLFASQVMLYVAFGFGFEVVSTLTTRP